MNPSVSLIIVHPNYSQDKREYKSKKNPKRESNKQERKKKEGERVEFN